MADKKIIFITGASGVGKTTLVDNLKEQYSDKSSWLFEHFDSIGVPSPEQMKKEYGSGEKWQEAKTHDWVNKLVNEHQDKELVIFEGQVNIEFIQRAFEKVMFENYKIVLIDTSVQEMIKRLSEQRKQPELANKEMENWLEFLRNQANKLGIDILETTGKTTNEVLAEFEVKFLL